MGQRVSQNACLTRLASFVRAKPGLLFVLLAGVAWANHAVPAEEPSVSEEAALSWPLLPGESVQQLARLFYPKNTFMQAHFVSSTLQLNRDIQPGLGANSISEVPRTILIPELKQLSSANRHSRTPPSNNADGLGITQMNAGSIKIVTDQMWVEYQALVDNNTAIVTDLEKLHVKTSGLERALAELKAGTNAWQGKSDATTKPEPHKFRKTTTSGPISSTTPAPSERSIFNGWAIYLALALLLALPGFFIARHWRRQRQAEAIDFNTILPVPFTDIPPTEQIAPAIAPDLAPVEPAEHHQGTDATIQEEKILVNTGKPAEATPLLKISEAVPLLKIIIETDPKGSLSPWLSLLEIYRKQEQKDEFNQLSAQMHQAFNVMAPLWDDVESSMVIPKTLEEFPHLIEQLETAWQDGSAGQFLDRLLFDNRDGEREGFSLEVLQEITLLQDILNLKKSDKSGEAPT
ncbi:hypothetical protein MTYP_01524 [Methylophilaceae bacterium]|nr:hypothetical protein MTYP_01524 [Methylophilaceae bacterium]